MLRRNYWYDLFTTKMNRKQLHGKVTWKDVYNTEEDIINDLMVIDYEEKNVMFFDSGYEYIHSFARRVQGGKELTPAQMRQAKRLAVEIRKAALLNDLNIVFSEGDIKGSLDYML
jgi:argonaute-like protein implicated in RNA metabolism and viral defense